MWTFPTSTIIHHPPPWFPGVQARMAEMQSRWEERFCEAVDFWHQAWSTTTSVAPMASWGSGGNMVRITPSVDDLFPGALPNGTNRIWSFAIKILPHNIHHNAGLQLTHVYSHPGLTLTPSWKSISLGWSRRYCSLEFRCGAIAPLCGLSNYIVMICHDYIGMIN